VKAPSGHPPQVQRWRCTVAYDGTAFTGWQSQPGGKAVQDAIERRLQEILGQETRIHGSGRTDTGVHALGQTFHFDATWPHGPAKLLAAFRAGLPETIQVRAAKRVPADFHARFSAKGKIYVYHLLLGEADPFRRPFCWSHPQPLDFAAMEAAAAVLRGRHDFRAFAAQRGTETRPTIRHLRRLQISRRGRRVRITAEAEGFLHKMVRSLVGALVAVGEGKLTVARVRALLAGRERVAAVVTAPPQGLFMQRVLY
jgi:tRNA pseudouridine38-40 synthase